MSPDARQSGCGRGARSPPHDRPASIVISINAGQWHVSFATEEDRIYPRPAEIQAELAQWDAGALHAATLGVDRGVVVPAYASNGMVYAFDPVQQRRMARKERQRQRWQRRMARRTQGSSGRHQARKRVAVFHGSRHPRGWRRRA